MKKRDAINKQVQKWDNNKVVEVWNDYVSTRNEETVYSMDMLNEILDGIEPLELLRMGTYGSFFNPYNEYFYIDGRGNLNSFNYPLSDYNSPIDISEIIDFIIENGDSTTPEIENDALFDDFIDEYYGNDCDADVRQKAEDYVYEENIDLLMEDWDILFNAIQQWGVEE